MMLRFFMFFLSRTPQQKNVPQERFFLETEERDPPYASEKDGFQILVVIPRDLVFHRL